MCNRVSLRRKGQCNVQLGVCTNCPVSLLPEHTFHVVMYFNSNQQVTTAVVQQEQYSVVCCPLNVCKSPVKMSAPFFHKGWIKPATISPLSARVAFRLPRLGPIFGQPDDSASATTPSATTTGKDVIDSDASLAGLVGDLAFGLLGDGVAGAGDGSGDDVEELFVEQRLDHFNRQNSRTFSQRYFINRRYVRRYCWCLTGLTPPTAVYECCVCWELSAISNSGHARASGTFTVKR